MTDKRLALLALQALAPIAVKVAPGGASAGLAAAAAAGSWLHCPPVGPHWDYIGFQGLDPCTDVNRSMKMLAILQARQLALLARPLLCKSFSACQVKEL